MRLEKFNEIVKKKKTVVSSHKINFFKKNIKKTKKQIDIIDKEILEK